MRHLNRFFLGDDYTRNDQVWLYGMLCIGCAAMLLILLVKIN